MLGEGEMLDLITTWLPPGGRVLDVGCGSGRMLTVLAERGISGIGIDPYASDTEHCRRLRAEKMDQLTERFDLVYTRYTLHHLDVPKEFPKKARSVLRPSGVLLIVDWVEGARTGVPERYLAPQTVAEWVRGAGFGLMREEVRGQSMIMVGKLPAAKGDAKMLNGAKVAALDTDSNNAIEVRDLTKYYGRSGKGVLAVDHISFDVRQGEVFGFLGPNGAGKTTTQRMLTTLLEPTEGRIVINGHDLARDAYPVKRRTGLVPEESSVYAELTAWDNLMFTARLYRVPRVERAARARELLETFGLWEKRDVKVEDFSKGMRRRLSIAMAIIHQPTLLFMDEPTPGLDAQSARAIRDLIRQLNAEGTTIFLTTHQIEEANQLCDRVAIIHHGQIAAIDTPEQLKRAFRRVQSVEVALEPDGQEHGEPLAALPGVTTPVKMGDKWRLYTEDPSALLPRVMDYARSHGLRVVSLSTLGPSLEDVFLGITGQKVGIVHHETPEDGPRRRRGMERRKGDGR